MDLGLKGKSVIVTAASKGLGKACALTYAQEGAHVLIASRDEKQLVQAVTDIKQASGNDHIHHVVCDVRKEKDIQNMVEKAVEKNGKVDVLVNNTGGPPAGSFSDFADSDWQNAFELLLLNVIRTVRGVMPVMKEQQFGRIVNITSSSMKQALDNLLLSNTFRPAIVGLSKSLAQELAPSNILINSVGPGTIQTDRILELFEKRADTKSVEEQVKEAGSHIPIGRIGTPEEFAKAIVFFGSPANTYITGQTLIVDGGSVKAL
ncbi:SDR family oxidoreductase [Gracilibacillus sp. YIM 98692]|uniref:SDR family oxidoreductase n=1 Tax=Gracilibacillus sp. YIM 98692 TaxID=2663532 RepID=UPI0013CFC771|nr:SDR family oxidoreductase [Gracilibacillus sp. YIM 98692]